MIKLKQKLINLGISDLDLAKAVGVSQPAVSRWFRVGSIPKKHTVQRIINFVNDKIENNLQNKVSYEDFYIQNITKSYNN